MVAGRHEVQYGCSRMQQDLLAEGQEIGGGVTGPPGGCFGQGQQPLGDQPAVAPCAIECPNDDSINVAAVHIVWLDLQPCIAAVIHLPRRV